MKEKISKAKKAGDDYRKIEAIIQAMYPWNDDKSINYRIAARKGATAIVQQFLGGQLPDESIPKQAEPSTGSEEDEVSRVDDLWDKYSEYIDDDIDSLSRYAGSVVMTKERFYEAVKSIKVKR